MGVQNESLVIPVAQYASVEIRIVLRSRGGKGISGRLCAELNSCNGGRCHGGDVRSPALRSSSFDRGRMPVNVPMGSTGQSTRKASSTPLWAFSNLRLWVE